MFGLPLYLHNAAQSTPINRGSNGPGGEMRKKRRKKREGKRERKEEKMGYQIAKKKKKKKKKKNPHTHTFFHRDPCAMTFRECKSLAVLDCEE